MLVKQEVVTTYNRAFLTPLFALIKTLRDIWPLQLRKLPYFRPSFFSGEWGILKIPAFKDSPSILKIPRYPLPVPHSYSYSTIPRPFFSFFRQIPPREGFVKLAINIQATVSVITVGEIFICSKIVAKSFRDGCQDIFKDRENNLGPVAGL